MKEEEKKIFYASNNNKLLLVAIVRAWAVWVKHLFGLLELNMKEEEERISKKGRTE